MEKKSLLEIGKDDWPAMLVGEAKLIEVDSSLVLVSPSPEAALRFFAFREGLDVDFINLASRPPVQYSVSRLLARRSQIAMEFRKDQETQKGPFNRRIERSLFWYRKMLERFGKDVLGGDQKWFEEYPDEPGLLSNSSLRTIGKALAAEW